MNQRSFTKRSAFPLAAAVVLSACRCASAVTQDDVFRSINDSMHQGIDYAPLIPWSFGLAGVVAVMVYFRHYQKQQAIPKSLNHQGKLMREVLRVAEIDPAEMKKYKELARNANCDNPLTLMLCPSLLNIPASQQAPVLPGPVIEEVDLSAISADTDPVSEAPGRSNP